MPSQDAGSNSAAPGPPSGSSDRQDQETREAQEAQRAEATGRAPRTEQELAQAFKDLARALASTSINHASMFSMLCPAPNVFFKSLDRDGGVPAGLCRLLPHCWVWNMSSHAYSAGENAATALEKNLTNLESKIDELLASFERSGAALPTAGGSNLSGGTGESDEGGGSQNAASK
ncbi:hypothetical protein J7T55_008834 [Diaporthe amygdali]|uniref:uncharacterized protein n=1 Tax=Phomopsis amygdali TaxID=1214568 RepID=UPI0022FE6A7D|nr:uncharacterized protein J7T55_008834 [Diaporthe amygdali]KAJ0121667.1 hypothetical protein J7T55_008834 [Diaporthe amygdali]